MLEPVAFNFHVEIQRKDQPHAEIKAGAEAISVARDAFWSVVDQHGASIWPGDSIKLRQGMRVILRYPPEQR